MSVIGTPRRFTIPILAPAVESKHTFDIFERLWLENRLPVGLAPFQGPGLPHELALVWRYDEGDEPVRRLGSVLMGPSPEMRAAGLEFPLALAPRPGWTRRQMMLEDTVAPYARVYQYDEAITECGLELDTMWTGTVAMPIVDHAELVMVVGVDRPQTAGFRRVIFDALWAFKIAAFLCHAPGTPDTLPYNSVECGIKYLEDPLRCQNIIPETMGERRALERLRYSKFQCMQELLLFAADTFKAFCPKGYAIATRLVDRLFADNPTLTRVVPGPWTNAIFDLGPQTVTRPGSLLARVYSWWWIAITALGEFDALRGGHLILWDLGRVYLFPPGVTWLIPPFMTYSIAAIQPGETRYSITQYTVAPPGWRHWPAATDVFSTEAELLGR
ncbi:hypothetical protein FB45DRAFT_1034229 [Roridomyces roridus]|uniref:Uncharacterized protein n=1 Tax=Roridomyces roridus TaxID=1738132 RepID=A0AAD7BDV0_9AGAR|nr:hypothetical protein FB45DRAFT_1034229 [Roridomyces roridus]